MSPVWESDDVFHAADRYFASLESGIAAARDTIDLETYIFADDPLGRRVADLLVQAARRGVRVRVLVDGVGSPSWISRFLPTFSEAGVEAKIYHPPPWVVFALRWRRRRAANRLLKVFQKINRRNHRKVCLVDHHAAWVGSMNVAAAHLKEFSGSGAWRDTGVRVTGGAVRLLEIAFERAWRRAWSPVRGVRRAFLEWRKRERRLNELVRLNDTRRKRRSYHQDLMFRITQARKRIWVTNPYFVPNRGLLQSLRFAAWLGVDVRVLVPRKNDVFFMRWASTAYYGTLLKAGARVFEFQPSVLHAKTILIDDWACVGTSNLNFRSWLHDLEVDIVLTGEKARASLRSQFVRDQRESREISFEDLRKVSLWRRIAGRVILLFRYWL